jgi:hypothetical protein
MKLILFLTWVISFNAFGQSNIEDKIISEMQNQMLTKKKNLVKFKMSMTQSELSYESGNEKVESEVKYIIAFNGEKTETYIIRDGKQQRIEEDKSNRSGERKGVDFEETLRLFLQDSLSVERLPDSDSLVSLRVSSRRKGDNAFTGKYVFFTSPIRIKSAEITPLQMPKGVTEVLTKLDYSYFEGYPVINRLIMRFKGKKMLLISFDRGMKMTAEYSNLNP